VESKKVDLIEDESRKMVMLGSVGSRETLGKAG
jgi:hypothetical protein